MINKLRLIYASVLAAIVDIAVITAVTIYAELSKPFKSTLASWSGHHWKTKSFLSIVIYLLVLGLVYWLGRNVGDLGVRRALLWLAVVSILGALALSLFFVWHYLGTF